MPRGRSSSPLPPRADEIERATLKRRFLLRGSGSGISGATFFRLSFLREPFLDLDGVTWLQVGVGGRHEPGTVAGAAGFLHLDCRGAAAT